ncbi:GNAT superfamily N-acetyltransferase [Hamadaea flava]|uniref:GNAT family N-acetyltransferase n=1 Tax=Hamadaea flava TaxID=1742688 RepID=A0ABV8LRW5_9ACTN|nr:GNAT family N-acetyltransferase [Hamadaea flava]MCP2321776.1 GNAT superfamily N-acetyltransferase [Hamadaea flava]
MKVVRVVAGEFGAVVDGLAEVLVDSVAGGASMGFLLPFGLVEARTWWSRVEPEVAAGRTVLWVAWESSGVVGTIQLKLELEYPNGRHRAEVAKFMVASWARGRGIGRGLLGAVEAAAPGLGVSLLVLDTETDSPAEGLYRSAGWTELGVMPAHSADPSGVLRPTTFFFKQLA